VIDQHYHLDKCIFEGSPHLNALHTRIAARPNIAAYLSSGRRSQGINNNGKGQ